MSSVLTIVSTGGEVKDFSIGGLAGFEARRFLLSRF
jgi:hypothetical protein